MESDEKLIVKGFLNPYAIRMLDTEEEKTTGGSGKYTIWNLN